MFSTVIDSRRKVSHLKYFHKVMLVEDFASLKLFKRRII